jgi:hypothetical protein
MLRDVEAEGHFTIYILSSAAIMNDQSLQDSQWNLGQTTQTYLLLTVGPSDTRRILLSLSICYVPLSASRGHFSRKEGEPMVSCTLRPDIAM